MATETRPSKPSPKPRRMTLAEFQKSDVMGGDIGALLNKFNGGSFMWCHTAIFESTGIWIDELVPVFQKLDAALATRDLRPVRG